MDKTFCSFRQFEEALQNVAKGKFCAVSAETWPLVFKIGLINVVYPPIFYY